MLIVSCLFCDQFICSYVLRSCLSNPWISVTNKTLSYISIPQKWNFFSEIIKNSTQVYFAVAWNRLNSEVHNHSWYKQASRYPFLTQAIQVFSHKIETNCILQFTMLSKSWKTWIIIIFTNSSPDSNSSPSYHQHMIESTGQTIDYSHEHMCTTLQFRFATICNLMT